MALFTSFWLYDLLIVVLAGLAAIYASFSIKFKHWKKKNVPVPFEPSFPFGHFSGVSTKDSMAMIAAKLYNKMGNVRFFGAYLLSKPIFVVCDLELVKNILVKDFSSFHDRGFQADISKEPLAGHLFLMNGQEWRNLRIKLTPTFTTGKMRMMFPTLIEVGKELEKYLEKCTEDPETEVKDILARYTTDVISSCAFGIETNSLQNPNAEFRKMGVELTHPKLKQILMNLLLFVFPKSMKYFPVKFMPEHITKFFLGVVRDTMQYRTDNNVKRNDFLQLLMQLKNLGYIPDADNPDKEEDPKNQHKFTLEQATAQAFLFFFAGFETSSATMQFALYELALNPELQSQVREEVDRVKAKHNGEFTYDAMQEMDLLDRVVAETLRKYPVAAFLIRECNTEYSIPDSDIVIEQGTNVWFPVYSIHHDPKNYPDPEKFDPDRFLPEEKEKRNHYAYIPFGEGPRNCIGNRFALMQTKAGLAIVLSRFIFSPSKKTPIPMVFDPKTDLLTPKGQMYLKITSRMT